MWKENRIKEIYQDIYQIKLPLAGGRPNTVNVYVFKGTINTILDTGIIQTFNLLKNSLNFIGLNIKDIDQVVLTHGHVDHYGAAAKIKRKAKCPVFIHTADAYRIKNGSEISRIHLMKFLSKMGIPIQQSILTVFIGFLFQMMAQNCTADYLLEDGDVITLGDYRAKIINTPGHSKGSICLYLEEENILFSGDHIIKNITPNAFAMLERGKLLPDRLSQKEFYDSLNKISSLKLDVIYSGHGEEIENLDNVIKMYKSLYIERQNKILQALNNAECTVYELTIKAFNKFNGGPLLFNLFLAVSEVYTHLQVLESEGKVRCIRSNKGPLLFTK